MIKKIMQLAIDRPLDNTPRAFNIAHAIKLRLKKNYTYQEIGEFYGITKQAVHQRLRNFMSILDRPESIDSINDLRTDILTAVEFKLLQELIDDNRLKEASLNNIAYTYTQINNSRLQELGKSPIEQGKMIFNVVYNDNRIQTINPNNTPANAPVNNADNKTIECKGNGVSECAITDKDTVRPLQVADNKG